ncbi:MAG: hypothetical protein Pg6C_17840 [Treponemataceae bacterium]|nr:MAG: hypothetical protein Pg6C_17840 [Treponemataceae bacterium]
MGNDVVSSLIGDFVYMQNPDGTYILDKNGKLQFRDRNAVVDVVLDLLKKIYTGIVRRHNADPGVIMCNDYVLDQALIRYSRDIFGELRLSAKIGYLAKAGVITNGQRENLSEFGEYGLKTDSCAPYLHRRIANLLYWLSVLKPFAVYADDVSAVEKLGVAFTFHNEYISYLLVLSVLKAYNLMLSIHKNNAFFKDFLYDLHFRKLSRSSLEFFLNSHLIGI